MLVKVALGILLAIIVFGIYVSTRKGKYRFQRSGLILATKEQIFPYLSNLQLSEQWSPYEKMDPNIKKIYGGEDGQAGSSMQFESKKAGTGSLEILKIIPNESVEMRLRLSAPIQCNNLVEFRLATENEGTRFTWAMSGDGGFAGKLINFFIDCESLVAKPFSEGIENLKILIEKK